MQKMIQTPRESKQEILGRKLSKTGKTNLCM